MDDLWKAILGGIAGAAVGWAILILIFRII